ncbi:hypothetical protein, partial [Tritonibacter mobilis]
GGTFTNTGTVSGSTTITDGTVTNNGGSFGGDVTIEGGANATLSLETDTAINGNVVNNGTIEANGSGSISLDVTGGHSLTNTGTLNGGTHGLDITADEIYLSETSIVGTGVNLIGDTTNEGVLNLDTDLVGDLTTVDGSQSDIVGDVAGNGNDVNVEGGSLGVADGVAFTGIGALINESDITVGTGATLEAE